jgi:putative ABC transport system permease protein
LKIRDNFQIAIKALLRKPLRTIIVLQGIIWGVALAVFPASVREGALNQARLRAQELGIDRVSIQLQDTDSGDALTLGDCDEMKRVFGPGGNMPETRRVMACAPVRVSEGLEAGRPESGKELSTDVIQTTPDLQEAWYFRAARGRYLTQDDIEHHNNVCVLEALAAEKMFGNEDPIGKTILVRPPKEDARKAPGGTTAARRARGKVESFKVVGVMEKRSAERLETDDYGFRDKGEGNVIERLSKPLGLLRPKVQWKRSEMSIHTPLFPEEGENSKVDWILIRASHAENTRELEQAVSDFLLDRGHRVAVFGNLLYPILVESEQHINSRLYLAVMVACMLMSGIAIMNTMLITVVEREREIAIRRTEGARRRDIAAQFITESSAMCVIGAVIGVPVGLGMSWLNIMLRPRFHSLSAVGFPWVDILIVAGAALCVGLVAGVLPAARAARLEPVVILSRSA